MPGTGIKICGTNADLHAALLGMWAAGTYDRGYLMTTTFRAGTATHVAPYAARIVILRNSVSHARTVMADDHDFLVALTTWMIEGQADNDL